MNRPIMSVATGIISLLFLLLVGTLFYSNVEGWSTIDSLFSSASIITTLGYGDYVPQTTLGKIFTIFYMFIGIGTVIIIAMNIGNIYLRKFEKIHEQNTDSASRIIEKVKREMLIQKFKRNGKKRI